MGRFEKIVRALDGGESVEKITNRFEMEDDDWEDFWDEVAEELEDYSTDSTYKSGGYSARANIIDAIVRISSGENQVMN